MGIRSRAAGEQRRDKGKLQRMLDKLCGIVYIKHGLVQISLAERSAGLFLLPEMERDGRQAVWRYLGRIWLHRIPGPGLTSSAHQAGPGLRRPGYGASFPYREKTESDKALDHRDLLGSWQPGGNQGIKTVSLIVDFRVVYSSLLYLNLLE